MGYFCIRAHCTITVPHLLLLLTNGRSLEASCSSVVGVVICLGNASRDLVSNQTQANSTKAPQHAHVWDGSFWSLLADLCPYPDFHRPCDSSSFSRSEFPRAGYFASQMAYCPRNRSGLHHSLCTSAHWALFRRAFEESYGSRHLGRSWIFRLHVCVPST